MSTSVSVTHCCSKEISLKELSNQSCSGICNGDFQLMMRLAQLSHFDVYKAVRLGPLSPKAWNTTGLACGLCRFRANVPVSITSYGFFGPQEAGSQGKYHMTIELLTENYVLIASTTKVTGVIRASEVFHVSFETPVPILPCTWYHARFYLAGPPTGQSQKLLSTSHVQCDDFASAVFRFEIPDSNQLPEIGFVLRI